MVSQNDEILSQNDNSEFQSWELEQSWNDFYLLSDHFDLCHHFDLLRLPFSYGIKVMFKILVQDSFFLFTLIVSKNDEICSNLILRSHFI